MADAAAVARLEGEVALLLQQIPTAASNTEQLELFHRMQEIALHRDCSGGAHRLLRAAMPFVQTIVHQQNAPLVAAILQLLTEAARRDHAFLQELFEVATTVLMLSYSSEKNVLKTLQIATVTLLDAFQYISGADVARGAQLERMPEVWRAVQSSMDHAVGILGASPMVATEGDTGASNRSSAVFLRAWKYLERVVLLLSEAKDATLYRDPARSNVQPDAVTIDRLASGDHSILDRLQLETFGQSVLQRLLDRMLNSAGGLSPLTTRELCVAINSLSLLAAMRPQLIVQVIPGLIACNSPTFPGSKDRVVQATLKANLVKLLSHPAAQRLAEEVTECLIALGDSERAFRAISKSKDPRRKYVSAPSEASLRRARIGKRTAERISESTENEHKKRARVLESMDAGTKQSERITQDTLVNMTSSTVVNLVLNGFTSDLSAPAPVNIKLLLPPSELKSRMSALLSRLATPSSALALESSVRRSRDPRRRKDPRVEVKMEQQPSLVQIFDDEAVEEVSDWISKNSATAEEPLVSVGEDNSVQIFLKPVSAVWCRDMASAALSRILDNEHGVSIRGDDAIREILICRLASSPWLLLTDERNATIHPSKDAKLPPVYESILDFAVEGFAHRSSLATALLYHEYVRVTTEQIQGFHTDSSRPSPPKTGDGIYRKAVHHFLSALGKHMDLSSASDKKLFGSVVAQLPRVTVEVLCVLNGFMADKSGAVLGITVLRDLIKERKTCEAPALRMLLLYTCDTDESCRNSSIRCVANQLYVIDELKDAIETYAVKLVKSMEDDTPSAEAATLHDQLKVDKEATGQLPGTADTTKTMEDPTREVIAGSAWLKARVHELCVDDKDIESELDMYSHELDRAANLSVPVDNEMETLRRLELHLALCAKKPALLRHVVVTYGRSSELVRQVIFQAIEKLIKHLKQRGSVNVVAHLHGFATSSLGLVCHIIQILAAKGRSSSANEAKANVELVAQVIELWHAHESIPDSISVLIPVLSSIPKETLFPLLPTLLGLPQNRWSVAITRVLEAMPPQVVTPIDLLIGLHHIDLKLDPTLQKKVILAINFCVEHRHAFPSDVLLHVCRVLVQEERISKLALRTLILSVTTYPGLQDEMARLLALLTDRRVWEMEDAIWKGFVKCSALIQPASFRVLLEMLPPTQLHSVLADEPGLRLLLREFITAPDAPTRLQVSDQVRAILQEDAMDAAASAPAATRDEEVDQVAHDQKPNQELVEPEERVQSTHHEEQIPS